MQRGHVESATWKPCDDINHFFQIHSFNFALDGSGKVLINEGTVICFLFKLGFIKHVPESRKVCEIFPKKGIANK